ncbi:unnamed protein product [Lactuca virosa]|uniref:ascorbate ferrireductase (transmembrane) n=1 Tax=Lactuca virosa TaxID=75947 RepID=A0AAU9MNM9_9ASTR|nr:unnamed protein product [Lactuca virosa]
MLQAIFRSKSVVIVLYLRNTYGLCHSYCPSFLVVYLSLLTHLLAISLASLVIYWLITFRNGFGLFNPSTDLMFNWHPLLMILGFIIFSAEAMIAYKAIRGTRQALKRVHLTLHSIALVTGLCGVYAACKYHYQLQVPHLYTLHSWYGYSTIWLFCLQFILGFDDFVIESATIGAGIGRSHGLAGLLIFWLAILSAGTGLMKKSDILHLYPGQVETNVVNVIGILLALLGVSVTLVLSRYLY